MHVRFSIPQRRAVDSRGHAVVEFAIVMPLLLMCFLAILQFFQVWRAYQHANYAAYAAARAYAVHASVDGPEDAKISALDAASMAFAPVARLAPGELAGLSSLTHGNAGLFALAEGYLTARYLRLNPNIGGGRVEVDVVETKGLPRQVHVEIHYPQPIFIPGLDGLWGLVGGGSELSKDALPLASGLDGAPGLVNRFDAALPEWFGIVFPDVKESLVDQFRRLLGRFIYPYVNVQAKCSMGYEDWGNPEDTYRPRMPRTVEDAGQSAADRRNEAEAGDFKDRSDRFKSQMEAEREACARWKDAQARLAAAERTYDQTPADPPGPKLTAKEALDAARADEAQARTAYETARNRRRHSQAALEDSSGLFGPEPECN